MKIIYYRFHRNALITVLGFVLVFYCLRVRIYQAHSTNPRNHLQIAVPVFQVYFQMLDLYFQWRWDNQSNLSGGLYNFSIEEGSESHVQLRLKSDSHLLKRNIFICFNESPLQMMKNAFYFILKALFVLKRFKFFSWHFVNVEETAWLER